ncbi:DEAD/DEAH box helicase [Salininema proteolyticum]|uniref:DEAD/DEAH box helicase n=1 Tax=Salininema proteolyticum TaxID=1607685 RepID=A0ABV8TWK3_9ACTN
MTVVPSPVETASLPRQVREVFADLTERAPRSGRADSGVVGSRLQWTASQMMVQGAGALAGYDALHRDERLLRFGWGFVIGRLEIDGEDRDVRFPVVSHPVRIQPGAGKAGDYFIFSAGDPAVASELADTPYHDSLISELAGNDLTYRSDRDADWLAGLVDALPYDLEVVDSPPERGSEGLYFVATGAVYVDTSRRRGPDPTQLRRWKSLPDLTNTAVSALYGCEEYAAEEIEPSTNAPVTSLPLGHDQIAAVHASRSQPVSVIAGAPGCGKTHTLAAIAQDALAHHQSVLIATQSSYAADVLANLINRYPGPRPVQFGDSERRGRFLTQLGDDAMAHAVSVRESYRVMKEQERLSQRVLDEVEQRLEAEKAYMRVQSGSADALEQYPGLADLAADELDNLRRQADKLDFEPQGRWAAWKRRRLHKRLARRVGSDDFSRLRQAFDEAADRRVAKELSDHGYTEVTQLLAQYDHARARQQEANTEFLNARANKPGPVLDAVAAALTHANRRHRAKLLRDVNPDELTDVAPLWIGTVRDIDAILPQAPGLFDLLILDEAGHMGQRDAVGALSRARRAVIAGDPWQLSTLDETGVRTTSVYDIAATHWPTTDLTEHHRGAPHLIGFSAERFYNGRVEPVTTHPRHHNTSAITVHRVDGTHAEGTATSGDDSDDPQRPATPESSAPSSSSSAVVNHVEIDKALSLLQDLVKDGHSSIALITPFPDQAEALETALVETFTLEELAEHNIASGTVHTFQGSETDEVIALFTATDQDASERLERLADPNLFNVMVTRARRHLHVVTSLQKPPPLVADFLAYCERLPDVSLDGSDVPENAWTKELVDALAAKKIPVRHRYKIGHHFIDLVVGEGEDALAVTCLPHPDGVRAHLDRHRVLKDNDWRHMNAVPSTFDDGADNAITAIQSRLAS